MAKDFKISKPLMACAACEREIGEGEDIIALVKIMDEELVREDYHPPCWVDPLDKDASRNRDILGVWRTTLPEQEKKKKKLLVDDAQLINFFEKLDGQEEPSRINFRFVLALILMRKRILSYEGLKRKGDKEIWKIKLRGRDEIMEVIDPGMDEGKIASVSTSLGQIMEGDFDT